MIAVLALSLVANLDPATLDPRSVTRWRACLSRLAALPTATAAPDLENQAVELDRAARRVRACGLIAEEGRTTAEDTLRSATSTAAISAAVERALERMPVAPAEPRASSWAFVAVGAAGLAAGLLAGALLAQ